MKKRDFSLWLICILPLVTSTVVLQHMVDISDFLRGALTGVCIGLLIMCILLKKKEQLPDR